MSASRTQVGRNRCVIAGDVLECLCCQVTPILFRHSLDAEVIQRLFVVLRVDERQHPRVVLGGGAEHGGPPNVDVFERVFEGGVGSGDSFAERVQVDADEVDGQDLTTAQLL